MIDTFVHDLRFAVRSLLNNPRFSLIAILTLALGIGANTAIFSVVNGVLLKDLPYSQPDELIAVSTAMTDGRATDGGVSIPEQHVIRSDEFPAIASVTSTFLYDITILDPASRPVRTNSYGVSEQFFETFGVPLFMGRDFIQEDFEPVPGGEAIRIILGYDLWQNVYGADPNIIGSSIETTEISIPAVGVAPPGFDYPDGANVWISIPHASTTPVRMGVGVARLAQGVPLETARSELGILASRLQEEFPGANTDRVFTALPLQDEIVGDMRGTLMILMGATATLLLIACLNVANLLLSRGAVRSKEVALRAALGAGRWRIVRQLLTESLVMAGTGAILGVAASWVALRIMSGLASTNLARMDEVAIDGSVLLFTVAITGLAGVLFGLAPAVRLLQTDIRSLLGEGARGSSSGPGQGMLLRGLVTGQMGLAVVLVIGAGLLVRSFVKLQSTDPGFEPENVLIVDVALPFFQSQWFREVIGFYETAAERVRAVPGVELVGATSTAPMGEQMDFWGEHYVVGRAIPLPGDGDRFRLRQILPGYFEAMEIPLVSGRYLNDFDVFENPGVTVINQAAANAIFPGEDPIGRRLHSPAQAVGDSTGNPLGWNAKIEYEIVGVVDDVRLLNLHTAEDPAIYRPHQQFPWRRMMLTVKTSVDPATLTSAVRDAIWEIDPTLALEFSTQESLLSQSLSRERLGMLMLTIFGFAALILASVGIYGVISYAVTQRTAEVAIRASLGLTPSGILDLMMRQGVMVTAVGIGTGIAAALALRQYIASQLYEISASDPVVFVAVPLLLLLVGLLAVLLPARRAMTINLADTLRNE